MFWLFTMQQTPRLIRPHVVVAWSSIAFLMILCSHAFLARLLGDSSELIRATIARSLGGIHRLDYSLPPQDLLWRVRLLLLHRVVRSLAFTLAHYSPSLTSGPIPRRFFAFWGGQTATWSLAASYIVHRRATSTDTLTWQVRLTNLLGPLVPVVYAAILLAFAIPGGTHYAHAIEVAREVDAQLLERASNWQPGQPFSILNLAWAMPLLQREAAYFADFLDSFRRVYAFFAVTAALLVIVSTAVVPHKSYVSPDAS